LGRESTRERGSKAELEGARWLERHGYRILARNVAFRFGELDVVALEGPTLCFVEIKARRTGRYGAPGEAVTPAKQRRLSRGARAWLARRPHQGPCRFDVLAMRAEGPSWRFELVRNAFEAPA
jgi:putative endonuclease